MKTKMNNKKFRSLFLCMMLIVAMAFTVTGCNDKKSESSQTSSKTETSAETPADTETDDTAETDSETGDASDDTSETDSETGDASDDTSEVQVLGEGQTKFSFTVTDKDGNETAFEIHTDKENVGDALLDLELIAGEDGDYGLYVKEVNGITADYDIDGTYWAFYVNGEYATSGVDTTPIKEGETYAFKVES